MAALTKDRDTKARAGEDFEFPVKAAAKIFAGAIVAIDSAGKAIKGQTALELKAVGVAQELADNSAGADDAIRVKVRRGVHRFANSAAGDAIALADVGADCYIVDDQTLAKTDGAGTRSVAGVVVDVEAAGVWVRIEPRRFLTKVAALDFPLVAAAGQQELNVALPGAEVNDAVDLGLPAAPNAGLIFQAYVDVAGNVKVRATNITAAGIDAGVLNFRVTIDKR